MNTDRDILTQIDALVAAHARGELDEAGARRLEALVVEDRDARRRFIQHMQLSASLEWERAGDRSLQSLPQSRRHATRAETGVQGSGFRARESVVSSPLSVGKNSPSTSSQLTTDNGQRTTSPIPQSAIRNPQFPSSLLSFRIPRSLAHRPFAFSFSVATVATVLAIFAAAQIRIGGFENRRSIPAVGEMPAFVAQFTGGVECRWNDESDAPIQGAHLRAGQRLDLRSGVAQIAFRSGAVALVEGPAEFQLEGENLGRLDRGRVVARIENKKAAGFAIRTPTANVVDLGTEFGVEVSATGTHVEVFTGVVEYRPVLASGRFDEPHRLTKGETARIDATSRQALAATSRASAFVRRLSPIGASEASESKERWLGNELIAREHAADGRYEMLVAYTNAPVPSPGTIDRFAFYKQTATGESHSFYAFILRPTGKLGEFKVVFDSGRIDTTAMAGGQVHHISVEPIEVEPGDVIAHFGHGIPFVRTENGVPFVNRNPSDGPPIHRPELSEAVTIGLGQFPFGFQLNAFSPERRSYSFAAHFVPRGDK